ncbi:MAG: hypothetical protein ABL929_12520 [Ferruginibacter sp.]
MRRIIISTITLCIISTVFIVSCKKSNIDIQESNIDANNSITSKSAAEQIKYAEINLKKIGSEIAKLTANPAFINFVHTEVNKKFDGEYEVLVEDLSKNPTFGNQLNSAKLNEGLNAFKNLEGENFFPHIYLPKFRHNEDLQINNTASKFIVDSILYVFFGGSDANLNADINGSFPAYYADENDSLRYWGLINETFADEHDVWIFALSESVDTQGRLLPCIEDECGGSGGGGGTGGGTGGGGPSTEGPAPQGPMGVNTIDDGFNLNYRIEKIKVKQHKESWVAGQSEVAIRAWTNKRNGRLDGNNNSYPLTDYYTNTSITDFKGFRIKNVKRRDVKNQVEFTINYNVATNWTVNDYNTKDIIYQYVIFEKDNWPVADRSTPLFPFYGEAQYASQSAFFGFKSSDDEYFIGSFYANKSGMTINIPQPGGNKTYNSTNFLIESREDNVGIKFNIHNF